VNPKPLFTVPLSDLERGPKKVHWPLPTEWLALALEGTDAEPGKGSSVADLTLTKTGPSVLVQGRVGASVSMTCAETLSPTEYDLDAEVFLSLAQRAAEAPRQGRGGDAPRRQRGPKRDAVPPQSKGRAPKAGWAESPELSEEDAFADTFTGEQIVLDPFLREFILLELPMVPLREDLRSADRQATAAPPKEDRERPLDPRLTPLAAIRERLRSKKE
jgi:uncharacterized protein